VKFRCERDNLLDALALASRVGVGRSSNPGPAGTRLALSGDALQVTGTDQDLTISTQVLVSGLSDGVVVAPGRLVTDIVRALEPGALVVEADDEELRLSAGRSHFMLRVFRASDFVQPAPAAGSKVSLPTAGLAEGLRQVVRAASSEMHRPVLTGVLLASEAGGLRMVATDSYRLAVKDLAAARGVLGEDQQVLVPSRALAELQRLLASAEGAVDVYLGPHEVRFDVGQVRLTARLIEGEFPPYKQLIPFNYPNKLSVAREAFLSAIQRVRLVARDLGRATDVPTPVRLALGGDTVQLSVITNELGQASEEVDVKYEGEEMTIAFNPQYLADGVEAVSSDEVVLECYDPVKPAILKAAGQGDYIYLLMPVRVA
jgi:DNA polymerase-3 subunit beta